MRSSKLKVKSFILFRSLFTVQCSLFVLCILHLVSVSNADAAYKIYLKNGSVIKGVSHYEKSGREIKFYFEDGAVGIPETDILKIETSKEPLDKEKAKPSVTEKSVEPTKIERPEEKPAEIPDVKKQADDAEDKKDNEIAQKEAELKKIEQELKRAKYNELIRQRRELERQRAILIEELKLLREKKQ
ncbi:MAG: hypothetical protein NTW44_05300 [Nitrospirae bacterium]|nr:hypothetical protein [Nitrospirota bacterium]